MSTYKDVVKKAIEEGWYLDSCGSDERYYSWGSFMDLCGMSVEDAMIPDSGGGEGDDKTKNTVNVTMQKGNDGEYSIHLVPTKAPEADVIVSMTVDGVSQVITIPAGVTNFDTGIKGENPAKPYASVSNITLSSEDETYKYSAKNNVQTGIFTLTMVKNGNKTTEQVKYGTEVELTSPGEREGYDFVWKDGSGSVITGSTYTMPESDAKVTGTYVAKKYTLTYNIYIEKIEGNSPVLEHLSSGTSVVAFGTKVYTVIGSLMPAKTGYNIDGWNESGTAVTSATTMPARDMSVNNTYSLKKYTLTYKADGQIIEQDSLYYTQAISPATPPEKTGYTVVGWDVEIPATMPARNITANAVYEAIKYYIRYFVDGAQKYSDERIYGDSITIRANESKEGYTFSGWDPSSLPATMPAEDIQVVGTFSINTYTLTCMVDGAEWYTEHYEYGATIDKSLINEPSKVGYTFTGWSPVIPQTMGAADVTCNAQFQINRHTLTYNVDGEVYETFEYDYGTAITPIAEPVKSGYTFSGWDDVPATMPDNDVEVNGTFEVNRHSIVYKLDGSVYETISGVAYGTELSLIPDPEGREGYTFSGWEGLPATMPDNDIEVVGTFDINYHTLTYLLDGEQYGEQESVAYGTALTPRENPESREGYTFSGWTGLPVTMPDNDVEVTGNFIINQYTMLFVLNGEPYTSITDDYNAEFAAPEVSAETGYHFTGWAPEVPERIPAQDMTFSGVTEINVHTASYYITNEHGVRSLTAETDYAYGAVIDYPDFTAPDGYILRWTKEYLTMPDMDIDIEGKYVEIPDATMVYYGMVPRSASTDFEDYELLDTFEYENGVDRDLTFTCPGDPEYDPSWSQRKQQRWASEHRYDFYILAPSNTNVNFGNSIGWQDIEAIDHEFTIDGNEYTPYHLLTEEDCPFSIEVDDQWNMRIKITKN